VQYAYTTQLARWIYEAIASYVEHFNFCDTSLGVEVEQSIARLLMSPQTPLDTLDGVHEYDEMLFIQSLVDPSQTCPTTSEMELGSLWESVAKNGDAISGIETAGAASIEQLLAQFGAWVFAPCLSMIRPAACANAAVRGLIPAPSTAPLPLAALSISFLSVPPPATQPCTSFCPVPPDVVVILNYPSGVALATGPTGAMITDTLTLKSPLPQKLYVAAGTAGAPNLSIQLTAEYSSTQMQPMPHVRSGGCGCALGSPSRNGAWLFVVLLSLGLCRAGCRGGRARP
jgi:hypothetical protein